MTETPIYFETESPDFNNMIWKGLLCHIAANRCILSIMTEFGLMNDRKMSMREYSSFIENIQRTTGTNHEG